MAGSASTRGSGAAVRLLAKISEVQTSCLEHSSSTTRLSSDFVWLVDDEEEEEEEEPVVGASLPRMRLDGELVVVCCVEEEDESLESPAFVEVDLRRRGAILGG